MKQILCNLSDRNKLGTLGLALVLTAFPLAAQQLPLIRKEFRDPGKQYRPMVRWWWPGANVSDEEIRREIRLLDRQGFGGAEIQPFVTFDARKLSSAEAAKVNAFATPSFFAHVRTAADAAKAQNMWIDDTFGTGWPFGGGTAITPELGAVELRFADTVIDGPKTAVGKVTIPEYQPGLIAAMIAAAGKKPEWPADWEARFETRSKIIAVLAMRNAPAGASEANSKSQPQLLDASSAIVLTDRLKPDGSLDWQVPPGQWHIFVFRQFPTRQEVMAGSGTGPQLVLDHMNRAAFAAHAARVGDPLISELRPDVGTSLRAIFCDSLEVQEYIFWSDDFLREFKARRGYDLTPFLPVLRQPGYNDFYFSHPGDHPLYDVARTGDTIRDDYWKTVAELMFENFYHPFDTWAKDHGLLSRVQAHGAPVDLLKTYGDASIPETEQLDGGNTINFMKLASSAGYNYGRRLVSSESFVFGGNPYVTTPETIKANSDKLFVSGINEIIYHGFPYRFDDGMVKGLHWFPFQGRFSSDMSEDNPIWPFVGKLNGYITRVQLIAQRGKPELQVALFRSALNEDDSGPSSGLGSSADPYPEIEKELTAQGLSFGFMNEDTLDRSAAKDGQLTTLTGGEYRAIVIPSIAKVTPRAVKALQSLAAAHIPVVFVGGDPAPKLTYASMQSEKNEIDAGMAFLKNEAEVLHAKDASEAAGRIASAVPAQVRFVAGDVLPFVKWTFGNARFYLLTNPNAKPSTTTVAFNETGGAELWDPWTGDIRKATSSQRQGRETVEVKLPPFGSELLCFGDDHGQSKLATTDYVDIKQEPVGTGGWSVAATGDSEKGVGVSLHLQRNELKDWLDDPDLRMFSGRATYRTNVEISAVDLRQASRVVLDLGEVKDAAEVQVNGIDGGQLLVYPFAVDIRKLLHPGSNRLQITVANSLTNYVGTVELPKTPGAPTTHFKAVSSGLLGPVVLVFEKTAEVETTARPKHVPGSM